MMKLEKGLRQTRQLLPTMYTKWTARRKVVISCTASAEGLGELPPMEGSSSRAEKNSSCVPTSSWRSSQRTVTHCGQGPQTYEQRCVERWILEGFGEKNKLETGRHRPVFFCKLRQNPGWRQSPELPPKGTEPAPETLSRGRVSTMG